MPRVQTTAHMFYWLQTSFVQTTDAKAMFWNHTETSLSDVACTLYIKSHNPIKAQSRMRCLQYRLGAAHESPHFAVISDQKRCFYSLLDESLQSVFWRRKSHGAFQISQHYLHLKLEPSPRKSFVLATTIYQSRALRIFYGPGHEMG